MEEKNELFQNLQSVRNINFSVLYFINQEHLINLEKWSQRMKTDTSTRPLSHVDVLWNSLSQSLSFQNWPQEKMSLVIKERAFWLLRLLVVAKRVLCQFSLQFEMTVTAVIFLRRSHVPRNLSQTNFRERACSLLHLACSPRAPRLPRRLTEHSKFVCYRSKTLVLMLKTEQLSFRKKRRNLRNKLR